MARKRSPRYPSIDLVEAVKLVTGLYNNEHTSPMDRETAVRGMGYSSLNGASARKLAAVSGYGLLTGRDEDIRVSDDAVTIIADEKSEDQKDRIEALERCLKSSAIFVDLLKRFPKVASEGNIASHLMKQGFTSDAAEAAASTYKSSLTFVEAEKSKYNIEDKREDGKSIDVGDLIQWEVDQTLCLPEPQRVRAIREHEGSEWVFIDGSETGIPMEQVILEQKGVSKGGAGSHPPMLRLENPTGNDANPKGNETEWLRGPLSGKSHYRIFTKGDIGPKQIQNLITVLEAQKKVLSGFDDGES